METLFKDAGTAVAVRTASRNTSKFRALVIAAFEAENRPQGYDGTVASLVWGGFARMSKTRQTWRRATFKALLLHTHAEGAFRILRSPEYIDVLINVSTFGLKMVRPVETWRRPSFSPDEQLEDLIDHLFATYPTPLFLITAFYGGSLSKMMWFIKLGQGSSVKALPGFPEHFTARMAHIFSNTPRGFDVGQAMVRAQALGFGASATVADTLAYTRLKDVDGNEKFWAGVIQFFANPDSNREENKNLNDFRILIDFLEFSVGRNRAFSLKGRTFASLTRDAIEWAAYTAKMNATTSEVMWYGAGIAPLHLVKDQDGTSVTYEIVEIISAEGLYDEGEDMHHCVGDYVDDCMSGKSAIFSLRKTVAGKMTKLATIEVDPKTRYVEEVQGPCNSGLTNEVHALVNTWSTKAKLDFGWPSPDEYTQQRVIAVGNRPEPIRDLEIPWRFIFWLTWIVIRVLWALYK